MRKLLKRWYGWLGLVLVLGFAGDAALIYANPSRITQANFDRIQDGMSKNEVQEILTRPSESRSIRLLSGMARTRPEDETVWICRWEDGPRYIVVVFNSEDKALLKDFKNATPWETLQWYAKKGAAKIGIKWD
jgi:hypothetical protein